MYIIMLFLNAYIEGKYIFFEINTKIKSVFKRKQTNGCELNFSIWLLKLEKFKSSPVSLATLENLKLCG